MLSASSLGHFSFSTVVAVPHAKNNIVTDFIEILTSGDADETWEPSYARGTSIRLTSDHLLAAGDCDRMRLGGKLPLLKAQNVEAGLCVLTVNGLEKITTVGIVRSQGIYTVVIDNEYVVVNGIVASPFAISHSWGRLFYSFYGVVKKFFLPKVGNDILENMNNLLMSVMSLYA